MIQVPPVTFKRKPGKCGKFYQDYNLYRLIKEALPDSVGFSVREADDLKDIAHRKQWFAILDSQHNKAWHVNHAVQSLGGTTMTILGCEQRIVTNIRSQQTCFIVVYYDD